jgi:gentisate 1,2-dioxygenase
MTDQFHGAMSSANVSALWERTSHGGEGLAEAPHLWHWETLDPLLDAAVAATDMDTAERRVLVLENPAYDASDRRGIGLNMVVNLQILMPGESARPHRHTLNALRFVIEGDGGAVTTVDGKPCAMEPGDFLLTPGMCWHEHSHTGETRAVWLDALDAPLHFHFDTNMFEAGPSNDIPPQLPEAALAAPGITPVSTEWTRPYSPLYKYPLAQVEAVLRETPPAKDGSRRIRYTNPLTGGAAMPGLDCYMLAPGQGSETQAYRSNANMVCLAAAGEGVSRIGDTTLTWAKNDIFTCPRGNWISHRATSDDAKLFQLTDRDVLAQIHYLREEFAD